MSTTLLRCGNHFDGVASEMGGAVDIVVVDGVIQEMGVGLTAPQGAEVVDLRERTVMPGFIDCHVHLTMVGVGLAMQSMQSTTRKALEGYEKALRYRRRGFTTIRDLGSGDINWPVIDLRNAINAGVLDGPRILAAGHFVVPTAGHGDFNSFYDPTWNLGWFPPADSVGQVRRAVRREYQGGSDWIKTCNSGGYHSPGDDPRDSTWFDDEMQALVDTATQIGLDVAVHCGAPEACHQAVEAGARSLEHAYLITDETIALAVEKGTYIVPTMYLNVADRKAYEAGSLPAFIAKKFGRDADDILHAHATISANADVKLALGTDVGMFSSDDAIQEFAAMVAVGIDPARTPRAGTSVAAELLRLPDLGVLAPGKVADIVAFTGDPIANIASVETVDWVMQGGRVVHGG